MKFRYLDGLRGLAAFIVLLDHFVFVFFPAAIVGSPASSTAAEIVHNTPLYLLVSGDFAVTIFFVLSGIVLSAKFFKTGDTKAVIATATKRYFRLAIPVLGSVLAIFAFLKLGWLHNHAIAAETGSGWWGTFWNFPADFTKALYEGTFGAFLTPNAVYNPPLWTMQIEFLGSFLVFMTLLIFGQLRHRWLVYIFLILALRHTYYLAFILGMIICDATFSRYGATIKNLLAKRYWLPVLGLSLMLGSYPLVTTAGTLFEHIPGQSQLAHTIGAFGLIIAVMAARPLQWLLETRPMQFLGRISFSLYLLHFLVLGAYSSYLFDHLPAAAPYFLKVLIAFIPTVAVALCASYLYAKFVDEPAIRLSGVIYRRIFAKDQPASPAPAPALPVYEPQPLRSSSISVDTAATEA